MGFVAQQHWKDGALFLYSNSHDEKDPYNGKFCRLLCTEPLEGYKGYDCELLDEAEMTQEQWQWWHSQLVPQVKDESEWPCSYDPLICKWDAEALARVTKALAPAPPPPYVVGQPQDDVFVMSSSSAVLPIDISSALMDMAGKPPDAAGDKQPTLIGNKQDYSPNASKHHLD